MQPDAEVRVPAETAYVAVIRMATAGIAARLDFTLDDVEDLRIAVGEACAMALSQARPEGSLAAGFTLADDRIDVRISVDSTASAPPDPTSFAWQVLSSTASDVTAAVEDGQVRISLSLLRDAAGQPA